MSFECNPCHVAYTGKDLDQAHFSFSYGRCETCARVDTCADCHCSPRPDMGMGEQTKAQADDLRALRAELLAE
jgi:hypothetical protein